jgi:hypothetical protein
MEGASSCPLTSVGPYGFCSTLAYIQNFILPAVKDGFIPVKVSYSAPHSAIFYKQYRTASSCEGRPENKDCFRIAFVQVNQL